MPSSKRPAVDTEELVASLRQSQTVRRGVDAFFPQPAQPHLDTSAPKHLGTKAPGHQSTSPHLPATSPPAQPTLDINDELTERWTQRVSRQEYDALDELERELYRDQLIKTHKSTLVRCAIHLLLKDYRERGEDSSLIKLLRQKEKKGPKK